MCTYSHDNSTVLNGAYSEESVHGIAASKGTIYIFGYHKCNLIYAYSEVNPQYVQFILLPSK